MPGMPIKSRSQAFLVSHGFCAAPLTSDSADDAALASDPLVYADLMATGDSRCIETAKLIFDRIVRADA